MRPGIQKLTVGSAICLVGNALQILVALGVFIQLAVKDISDCQTTYCTFRFVVLLFEFSLVIVPGGLALNAIRRQKFGLLWLLSLIAGFSSLMMVEINWISGYLFCPGGLILILGGVFALMEFLVTPRKYVAELADERSLRLPEYRRLDFRQSPILGLLVWALSLVVFYTSWAVILSTAKSAAGNWPAILDVWLYIMFAICAVWSGAAAYMFRKQVQNIIAAKGQVDLQPAKIGVAVNLVTIAMICFPVLLIAVFVGFNRI